MEPIASRDLVVACDAGTSGARAAVFDARGELLSKGARLWAYDAAPGVESGLRFDPEAAWKTMAAAISEAVAALGPDRDRIRAASVTSQRLSLVLADEEGGAILGLPNIDRRAVAEAAAFSGARGERVYGAAGRWPGPGHPLCKLLWLKAREPGTLSRAAVALSLGDWLALRLCGIAATEPTSACETCLFDIAAGRWNLPLAAAHGIDPAILPRVLPSGKPIGEILRSAAEITGLPAGTLVVTGAADTECGVLGMGARAKGDAAAIAGSSAPVECVVDEPVTDPKFRTLTNPYLEPGSWVVESNAMLAGASYSWLVSLLSGARADREMAAAYEEFEAEVEAAEIGSRGASCFLGSSIMDSRRGNFTATAGILAPMGAVRGRALTRGDLARSALEAEAFAIKANLAQLEEVTGLRIGRLGVGGGALRSRAFREILPDVLGAPVLAHDEDTTLRGCAMCAAVGSGLQRGFADALETMVPEPVVLSPRTEGARAYAEPYRRWVAGFESMRGLDSTLGPDTTRGLGVKDGGNN